MHAKLEYCSSDVFLFCEDCEDEKTQRIFSFLTAVEIPSITAARSIFGIQAATPIYIYIFTQIMIMIMVIM